VGPLRRDAHQQPVKERVIEQCGQEASVGGVSETVVSVPGSGVRGRRRVGLATLETA
jgi:hypothetical protein